MVKCKKIEGFEHYLIFSDGRVKNTITNKFRKIEKLSNGYNRVVLCKDGVIKRCLLHRLIGVAFIPNPKNKKTINHKNSIRNDNRICNLEWATNSENQKHSYRTNNRIHARGMLGHTGALHHHSRAVNQIDIKTNAVINNFGSISEGVRMTGITNISLCVRNPHFTAGGYKWEYAK